MLQEYTSNPKKLSTDIKDMVLNGDVNPLLVKVMFDIFNDTMKDSEVRAAINAEADLHGEEIDINGFKYKKARRTTYSFKHDAEWQRIDGERKAREELMKMALKQDLADPNTGEIIVPAMVSSSEFLRKA